MKETRQKAARIVSQIRFRDAKQHSLIKKAAAKADTSLNSFIRRAAEKAALEELKGSGHAKEG